LPTVEEAPTVETPAAEDIPPNESSRAEVVEVTAEPEPEQSVAQEQPLADEKQDVETSPAADQEPPVETSPAAEQVDAAPQNTLNEGESDGSQPSAVEDSVAELPTTEEAPEPETVTSDDPPATGKDDDVEVVDAGEPEAKPLTDVAESDKSCADTTGKFTFRLPSSHGRHRTM
jgi:hypothetical protein